MTEKLLTVTLSKNQTKKFEKLRHWLASVADETSPVQVMIPGPEVIKTVSCSTQLSMKFKLLNDTEIPKINANFRFNHLSCSLMLKCQQLLAF